MSIDEESLTILGELARTEDVSFIRGGRYGGLREYESAVVLQAKTLVDEDDDTDSFYERPTSYAQAVVRDGLQRLAGLGWTFQPGLDSPHERAEHVGIALHPPKDSDLADFNTNGLLKRIASAKEND